MAINADKPMRWKADIAASIAQYNNWFISFAPNTYRETRNRTIEKVRNDLAATSYLTRLTPDVLTTAPSILSTLRMSTAPPLARDRLIGLAQVPPGLVDALERGRLPQRMASELLAQALKRICTIILQLADEDLFPWLRVDRLPDDGEQLRAASVVADRLCGSFADPIIRNAQESRQLTLIGKFLVLHGYEQVQPDSYTQITDMPVGTFSFRRNVPVGDNRRINIPIDVIIQPYQARPNRLPIFIEAKSAGDFTNTNKRRKEEATKIRQLRDKYGEETQLISVDHESLSLSRPALKDGVELSRLSPVL